MVFDRPALMGPKLLTLTVLAGFRDFAFMTALPRQWIAVSNAHPGMARFRAYIAVRGPLCISFLCNLFEPPATDAFLIHALVARFQFFARHDHDVWRNAHGPGAQIANCASRFPLATSPQHMPVQQRTS